MLCRMSSFILGQNLVVKYAFAVAFHMQLYWSCCYFYLHLKASCLFNLFLRSGIKWLNSRASETGEGGGPGGHGPPLVFKAKNKINNSNRNKLKIHNITPGIGQSIYLNFI